VADSSPKAVSAPQAARRIGGSADIGGGWDRLADQTEFWPRKDA
jgi:hypothetical protein